MSTVLYRKYRPKSFSELIGQEHVVKTITNALLKEAVSHAYLFSGPRGSGKTTIARLLAKALNCHNRKKGEFEPCNNCPSCKEIAENRSLDLIEIDAASNRGIDEIRDLREGIRFSPAKEKYKVFIIDEAHQLTKEAVNALLKTLEEPPSHAVFILATTEIHKMIPTIISRCQRFDFRKLRMDELIKRLEILSKKEGVEIDKDAFNIIAVNSGGALRDAESLLDQVLAFSGKKKKITREDIKSLLGIADINMASQFTEYIVKKDPGGAIKYLQNIVEKGYDPQEFLKILIQYMRQALIMKINPDITNPIITGLTEEEQMAIKEQTDGLKEEDIRRALNLFLEAENRMKYSSIQQLPLELAIIEIILPKE
ncbi:MAG: DNA polymerase III subunit gamma/tau [Candidatus Pacebacteria bacterium]|nr:DNA polymerase III subunit gamma/tau [Candidatus Paceibacterota bacterium]